MIDKEIKNNCSGCKMCKDVCPQNAIAYETDKTGFWYPKVDYQKCVSCGLCVRKCPALSPIACRTKEPKVYAAWSKDREVRLSGTSGGMFYELARKTLSEGGYVVGCVYENGYKGARHIIIDTLDALPPLLTSKYFQSDTENIFKATKERLSTGKKVLFVSAPCHIAALVSFLGTEYENLILCDFLCRGISTPKLQEKYIEYLENRFQSKLIYFRSKDKRNGWNNFGQYAQFESGAEYFGSRQEDLRISAYHNDLTCRDACYDCRFRKIPRVGADITLADFWGIQPEEVDDIDAGISLVLANNDKAEQILASLESRIVMVPETLEKALKQNPVILNNASSNRNRKRFLNELETNDLEYLVKKYKYKPSPLSKLKMIIGTIHKRKNKND